MFFYRCSDIPYVLRTCFKNKVGTNQSLHDFWIRTEDLLLRKKNDLTLEQLVDLIDLYSEMKKGS